MSVAASMASQGELPLSHELLTYYQARAAASEDEMASLRARIDEVAVSKEEAHKVRWELQKRNAEVAELQRALSDSHVYVWEERDRCQRMQAENDELRIQEAEDRRKIQCAPPRPPGWASAHATPPPQFLLACGTILPCALAAADAPVARPNLRTPRAETRTYLNMPNVETRASFNMPNASQGRLRWGCCACWGWRGLRFIASAPR
jgi:hypothetical protein